MSFFNLDDCLEQDKSFDNFEDVHWRLREIESLILDIEEEIEELSEEDLDNIAKLLAESSNIKQQLCITEFYYDK